MMIDWTRAALADREAIFDYIETESPRAAVAVDDRIDAQIERLKAFPEAGRSGRVEGTRELVLNGTPYVAVYAFRNANILILRVLHGAQQWPEPPPTT
jgi:toxin ParE1/3/4